MSKYRIIGCMTGNSMDAIDLVLTEFEGENIKDICSYSKPYLEEMREKIEKLRECVFDKTQDEILNLPEFCCVHEEYVKGVALAIGEMCEKFGIDKNNIDAVGFHGKTLDHYPLSKAVCEGNFPYTLQMGSGEMLADLIGMKVVSDFRSDFVVNGKEGAPLVGRHNVNIAKIEGDGVYFNGGNTSNFAIVRDEEIEFQTDVGPFNEYVDMYVRKKMGKAFDEDGKFGKKGKLCLRIMEKAFELAKEFYELRGGKSGDPQYYKTIELMEYLEDCGEDDFDIIHTLEYFSAYIAVRELLRSGRKFESIKLFGGGWKNPIVRNAFMELLNGKGIILEQDRSVFRKFYDENKAIEVCDSEFGDFMEARLMADMARYCLEGKAWDDDIVSGVIAYPDENRKIYDDIVSRASKGWELFKNYL